MRPPSIRFTTRQMMAILVPLALTLAGLRHALTNWGTAEIAALAPIVLVATNILAWFRRARRQVFWVGFGLCGWAYLTFALITPPAEHLPTTRLVDILHDRLYAGRPDPSYEDVAFVSGGASPIPPAADFRQAGHSAFSLLFALLGGSLALVLIPPRDRVGSTPLPPDGSLLKPGWRDEPTGRPRPKSPGQKA